MKLEWTYKELEIGIRHIVFRYNFTSIGEDIDNMISIQHD
jgi:hypothetical protein